MSKKILKRINCVICKNLLSNILRLNSIPYKLVCSDEPILNDNYDLSISKCSVCNTFQLDELIPLEILYSGSHNIESVGDLWKNYFINYTDKIKNIINNKTVLEVGCPSGKILKNINNFNKYILVDPNINHHILNFNIENYNFENKKNIILINKFFDNNFKFNEKIDIIINSHFFEHLYEPIIFLNKCFEILNDNGELFIGVPNMETIKNEYRGLFFGLSFEHTYFINEKNMKYLMESNGFEIINIFYYTNHSVFYHCKKINDFNNNLLVNNINLDLDLESFYDNIDNYKKLIIHSNNLIENTDKKVYIFSASYTTQFILSLGLNINKIYGIIDNSKEKQNKYLFGFPLKIYSPDVLKDNDCIVILKNLFYSEEIKKQIISINPNTLIIE